MKLPSIKIGKQKLKNQKFNMSHDANHTCDFGRVGCMTVFEMIPKSSLSVSVRQIVRMLPLSVPTVTRMKVEVFHRFVPVCDIFEPYENLYTGQSYGTASTKYIPTSVPVISMNDLCRLLFRRSYLTVYRYDDNSDEYQQIEVSSQSPDIEDIYLSAVNTDAGHNYGFPHYISSMNPDVVTINGTSVHGTTIAGADYVIKHSYRGVDYILAFRFTNAVKSLRSILLGLGYQLDVKNSSNLSALPIFAFYKAYFDTFVPQQKVSWTNTVCYQILDFIRVHNAPVMSGNSTLINLTKQFFDELAICYFTDNHDIVSAHISSAAIGSSMKRETSSYDDLSMQTIFSGPDSQPSLEDTIVTANSLRSLLKLNTLRNISTNIGGRLGDLLRALTGSDELHNEDSHYIGHSTLGIGIQDMNAQTAGEFGGKTQYLGETAGKGFAMSDNDVKTFKYETDTFGYWIVMYTVVPDSNYFQGVAPHLFHRNREEQYLSMFDGLGYEISPKSMVFADRSVLMRSADDFDDSFGFIPQYSSFKYHNDVVGGSISLRSSRQSLMPFNLNKFITPDDIYMGSPGIRNNSLTYDAAEEEQQITHLPVASTEWRYINKYPWLSNFNRIFPNGVIASRHGGGSGYLDIEDFTLVSDDPFYLFNAIDASYYAPMKSIAESFDTDGEGDAIEVQKA